MEIRQGYSYHIKDEFFDLAQDKDSLGKNKVVYSWDLVELREKGKQIKK